MGVQHLNLAGGVKLPCAGPNYCATKSCLLRHVNDVDVYDYGCVLERHGDYNTVLKKKAHYDNFPVCGKTSLCGNMPLRTTKWI